MTAPLPPSALLLLDHTLADPSWRLSWDEHARRFGAAFAEAMRPPLRSLGVATSVAVAYTAARSSVALAPAAYHEAWARVTLATLAREVLRRASGAALLEGGAEELGRCVLDLTTAAERLGFRGPPDEPAPLSPPVADRLHDQLVVAREHLLAQGAHVGFVKAFFSDAARGLATLGGREVSAYNVMRGVSLRAARAASVADPVGWSALPAQARRGLLRWCITEAAASLVDGVPQALAQSAQAGHRDGKAAAMAMARHSSQVLACLSSVDGWVWEGEHVSPPEAPPEARPEAPALSSRSQEEVKKPMTMPKPPLMKTLQSDASDAAWRLAASQFVKLTREPLVAVLQRHLGPGDESMRARIATFLETDVGASLLASMLSIGLSAMPNSAGEVPQRLAKELRIKAMTDMGDLVADVLMGPLRQVISLYLQDMPATPAPAELPAANPPELNPADAGARTAPVATADREPVR